MSRYRIGVFFVKVGDEVKIKGGLLKDAINRGTELGYRDGYLRASTCEPFSRANLKDEIGYNLPAIIHFDLVEGDKIGIEYAARVEVAKIVTRVKVFPLELGRGGGKFTFWQTRGISERGESHGLQ